MTDIVERLREAAAPSKTGVLPTRKLYSDAADEIERLRKVLRRIDKFIVAIAPKPTKEHIAICKEIQHALREVER